MLHSELLFFLRMQHYLLILTHTYTLMTDGLIVGHGGWRRQEWC